MQTEFRKIDHKTAGFSLLEILVAMAILSVIIMTLSTVFNQSSIAWDRGLGKSEKAMEGRSALNLMTTDLKNAVAGYIDGVVRLDNVSFGASSMSFNTIGRSENGERAVKFVTYNGGGGTLTRTAATYNDNYIGQGASSSADLITGMKGFNIVAGMGGSTTNLPESVTIQIDLEKSVNSSTISVRSAGPNGNFGNGDDIISSERK